MATRAPRTRTTQRLAKAPDRRLRREKRTELGREGKKGEGKEQSR